MNREGKREQENEQGQREEGDGGGENEESIEEKRREASTGTTDYLISRRATKEKDR